MKYIGAIDQGTTSTRFMIFDHGGNVVASSQKEFQQIYPAPGLVEHDPEEIWQTTITVVQAALKKARIEVPDLAAVGITNQRETTVAWNRNTGKAYHNAIVWQDTRTDDICGALAQDGGQDRFRAQVGLPLATYFSGPKIKWMLENVPAFREDAERGDALVGTIDSWLLWNLTGGIESGKHYTDVTNASRTMLMDLQSLDWEPEILKAMGIPRQILPEIRSSSEIYAKATDLLPGVPIAGVLGDQQAATFGQTCYNVGEAKNTYGTGCFMLINTGEKPIPSNQGLLTTLCYKLGELPAVYALEGSIAITGALVQWLRDNLKMFDSAAEIEALATTVADNGGVYFVPAFSGLFAPYWRSDARGVIAGLTRYANRGHIARAALEATAYQTLEVLEAMEKDAGIKLNSLKVDGGMVANELLMQFQADMVGVPVIRPKVAETTALGAAYAAGLAIGYWNGLADLRKNWAVEKEWRPNISEDARYQLYSGWKKAVERTFDWVD